MHFFTVINNLDYLVEKLFVAVSLCGAIYVFAD